MIVRVEQKNDSVYTFENSRGVGGMIGIKTLLALIRHQGANEEVQEYLQDQGYVL